MLSRGAANVLYHGNLLPTPKAISNAGHDQLKAIKIDSLTQLAVIHCYFIIRISGKVVVFSATTSHSRYFCNTILFLVLGLQLVSSIH